MPVSVVFHNWKIERFGENGWKVWQGRQLLAILHYDGKSSAQVTFGRLSELILPLVVKQIQGQLALAA